MPEIVHSKGGSHIDVNTITTQQVATPNIYMGNEFKNLGPKIIVGYDKDGHAIYRDQLFYSNTDIVVNNADVYVNRGNMNAASSTTLSSTCTISTVFEAIYTKQELDVLPSPGGYSYNSCVDNLGNFYGTFNRTIIKYNLRTNETVTMPINTGYEIGYIACTPDGEKFYISEYDGSYIDIYTKDGNYNGQLTSSLHDIAGIAVGNSGKIYVCQLAGYTPIVIFANDGDTNPEIRNISFVPIGIGLDKNERIYVINNSDGTGYCVDTGVSYIAPKDTGLGYPLAKIYVDSHFNVIFTNTYFFKIERFFNNGTYIDSIDYYRSVMTISINNDDELFIAGTGSILTLYRPIVSIGNGVKVNADYFNGDGSGITNVQASSIVQPFVNLSCNAFYTSSGPVWDSGTFISHSDSTAISPDGTWIAYGNSSSNQVYRYHNKTLASTLTVVSPKFLAICNTGLTAVSNTTGISLGDTFISTPSACVPSLSSDGSILVYGTSTDVYVYGGNSLHFDTPSNYQAIVTPDGTKIIVSNPPQSCANVYYYPDLSYFFPLPMPSSSYYIASTNTDGSIISVSGATDARIFKNHATFLSVSTPLILNTTSGSNTFSVSQTDTTNTGITWSSNTNGVAGTLPLGTTSTYTDSSIVYVIAQDVAIRSNTMNVVMTNIGGSSSIQFVVSSNLLANIYSTSTVLNTSSANSFSIIQDSNAYGINWNSSYSIPTLVTNSPTDRGVLFSIPSKVAFLPNTFIVSAFTNPGGTVSKTITVAANCVANTYLANASIRIMNTTSSNSFSLVQDSNAYGIGWTSSYAVPNLVPSSTDKAYTITIPSKVAFLPNTFTVSATTDPGGTVTKTFTMTANCAANIYSSVPSTILNTTTSKTFSLVQDSAYGLQWTFTNPIPSLMSNSVPNDGGISFRIPSKIVFLPNTFTVTATSDPGGTVSKTITVAANCAANTYLANASIRIMNTTTSNSFSIIQDSNAYGIGWTSTAGGVFPKTFNDYGYNITIPQSVTFFNRNFSVSAFTNPGGTVTRSFTASANCVANTYLADSFITVMDTTADTNSFSIVQDSNAYGIQWNSAYTIPDLVSNSASDSGVVFTIPQGVTFLQNTFTVTAITNPGGTESQTFTMSANCTPVIDYHGDNPLIVAGGDSFSFVNTSNARLVSWFSTWNDNPGLFPGGGIVLSNDQIITLNVAPDTSFSQGTLNMYAQTSVGLAEYSLPISTATLRFVGYDGSAQLNGGVSAYDSSGYVNWFNQATPTPGESGFTTSLVTLTAATNGKYNDNTGTYFSIKWTGYYTPTDTGTYNFFCGSDDGSLLTIGGTVVVNNINIQGFPGTPDGSISLTGGTKYPVALYYDQADGDCTIEVYIGLPVGSPADGSVDFGSLCTLN